MMNFFLLHTTTLIVVVAFRGGSSLLLSLAPSFSLPTFVILLIVTIIAIAIYVPNTINHHTIIVIVAVYLHHLRLHGLGRRPPARLLLLLPALGHLLGDGLPRAVVHVLPPALVAVARVLLGAVAGAGAVGKLAQLGHEEAVHVLHVRVEPHGQGQAGVEPPPLPPGEARAAVGQARVHELHVPPGQRVGHHRLVLRDAHAAGGVHDDPAGLGLGVHAVDGGQEQLLLEVGRARNVRQGALELDGGVAGDDAQAGAGRVQQAAVEPAHHLGQLPPVVAADDGVAHAQAGQVGGRALLPGGL
mmetsp:Transcript_18740/g.31003  ORF Transcript_18740/g.31003 Transcript_18740/m.31003 type:complete len:301 (+) Transcript_18740:540-1442(+)